MGSGDPPDGRSPRSAAVARGLAFVPRGGEVAAHVAEKFPDLKSAVITDTPPAPVAELAAERVTDPGATPSPATAEDREIDAPVAPTPAPETPPVPASAAPPVVVQAPPEAAAPTPAATQGGCSSRVGGEALSLALLVGLLALRRRRA